MPISSLNPMIDHLLESSHRDDSNKWLNIWFGEEIGQVVSIEVILSILSGALFYPLIAECIFLIFSLEEFENKKNVSIHYFADI